VPTHTNEVETLSVDASQAPGPELTLGIVATPGLPADMAPDLAAELRAELSELYPELTWRLPVVSDALVGPPALLPDLIDAGRRKLLSEGWDMALCLTDLPLPTAGRTVAGHVSVSHSVVVISLPAIGVVAVRRRLREAALRLIGRALDGSGHRDASDGIRLRRLQDLADLGDDGLSLGWGSRRGGGRLMVGMLRANRPWRLGVKLYRALIASLAVVAAALVTTDVWRIAVTIGWARLCAIAVFAVLATTVTLIAAHDLWERSEDERSSDQVVLFNIVTSLSLLIGLLTLYAALLLVTAVGALLLVSMPLFQAVIGRPVGAAEYIALIWLVASLAMVGGALGAGLEADSTVREAAYGYRPDVEPPTSQPDAR
jgi:hypothetical protein